MMNYVSSFIKENSDCFLDLVSFNKCRTTIGRVELFGSTKNTLFMHVM